MYATCCTENIREMTTVVIKFRQVGNTGLYNLYINGALHRSMIPMDEVLKIISEKEIEDEHTE